MLASYLRRLQSLALPLFMFPFLRDCQSGDDHGWERGQRLSEAHGSGSMEGLEPLPDAFTAFVQVWPGWGAREHAGGALNCCSSGYQLNARLPVPLPRPQSRRARLDSRGTARQGWAVLWFLFKYNGTASIKLAAVTVAYIVFRCGRLCLFEAVELAPGCHRDSGRPTAALFFLPLSQDAEPDHL